MSQAGKIALITGANKGIGFETAKQLGAMGVHVLIGARDAARGNEAVARLAAEKISAEYVQLEVTSESSVAAAADRVRQRHGRLDILVNNAGTLEYAVDGLPGAAGDGVLRRTFDINFFGLASVTRAFLPLIRLSTAGRIVNLTSILGSIAEHADPNSPIYQAKFTAYDCSKAAVNMFTNHLAHELRGTNIKVNAAHPGWVKTDLGGPDAPMEQVDGAKTSVWLATLDEKGPSGGYFHMMVHMRW
ncbi:MAG: SDR family oxidoreductase [Planctomycetota bacterium]|nr:SDR family oxidoreductase [Planctomycetota bacterium]